MERNMVCRREKFQTKGMDMIKAEELKKNMTVKKRMKELEKGERIIDT